MQCILIDEILFISMPLLSGMLHAAAILSVASAYVMICDQTILTLLVGIQDRSHQG